MRSAGEVRRDEPRAARAGNSAGKVLHETRFTAFAVHRPSDIIFLERTRPRPWFSRDTKHETRITAFMALRVAMGTKGSHLEKPPPGHCFPASGRLAILLPGHCCPVHYCSLLFTIVRHCSVFFLGEAPRAAVRAPSAPATRPVGFSRDTRHSTYFSPALRGLQGEQPQARPTGFSRITRHGFYGPSVRRAEKKRS